MADKWANAKNIENRAKGLSGDARGPVWPQGDPGLGKGTKTMRTTSPFLALKWCPGPTFRGFYFVSVF